MILSPATCGRGRCSFRGKFALGCCCCCVGLGGRLESRGRCSGLGRCLLQRPPHGLWSLESLRSDPDPAGRQGGWGQMAWPLLLQDRRTAQGLEAEGEVRGRPGESSCGCRPQAQLCHRLRREKRFEKAPHQPTEKVTLFTARLGLGSKSVSVFLCFCFF